MGLIVGTPLMLVSFGLGCAGARRLRRGGVVLTEGWIVELSAELKSKLQITRRVTLALNQKSCHPFWWVSSNR
jgi:hypothetical protein